MNAASERRLKAVHPELAKRIQQLAVNLASQGITVEVVQGLRTFAEQDALYAQGRTKPGKRVTNARSGQSNHNYGLAVDMCPFVNGKPDWNDTKGFKAIGAEGKKLGLEWGGDWIHIIDMPHLQLPGLSINQCSALYKHGGLPSVWETATALLAAKG